MSRHLSTFFVPDAILICWSSGLLRRLCELISSSQDTYEVEHVEYFLDRETEA